jgi:type I restriction enzyme, R subunit
MSLHKEISFETEICQHLGANGWLHREGDAAVYDRARALFPPGCAGLCSPRSQRRGERSPRITAVQAGETLLARLRDQPDQRGTLDVLRM